MSSISYLFSMVFNELVIDVFSIFKVIISSFQATQLLRREFLPDLEQSLLKGVLPRARLPVDDDVAAPDVDHVAVGVAVAALH